MDNKKMLGDMTVGEFMTIMEVATKNHNSAKYSRQALLLYRQLQPIKFTNEAYKLTLHQVSQYERQAEENFIVIHRVNYAAWTAILSLTDYLETKGRLKFATKHEYNKMKKIFDTYVSAHRNDMEDNIWFAFLDYMRIANDLLQESEQKLRDTVRDHLIMHRREMTGQPSDILLIVHTVVCLLLLHVVKNSFCHFFRMCGKKLVWT